MTETAVIDGTSYTLTTEVRDNCAHFQAFNALSKQVFGLDFAPWRADGWWDPARYAPHLLLDGEGRAAANVSASIMEFVALGRPRRYMQIGTVMTRPDLRGKGLARRLMERVLAESAGRYDAVYLHANDTVLGFYPKFGFAPAREHCFALPLPGAGAGGATAEDLPALRPLDMARAEDRQVLLAACALGNPFSALNLTRNPGLLMFYCGAPGGPRAYAIDRLQMALVVQREDEKLTLLDVYGPAAAPLHTLAGLAAGAGEGAATEALLGFTPLETAGLRQTPPEADSTLFILQGGENLFAGRPLMMPLLSHT